MESSESSPGTPSRDSADSPPTVATWTTSPDVSLLDVSLDDGSGASPAASLSARREEYVLVTGGLGFIGSHTVVELVKAGYNVIIVDDLSNSYRSVLDGILEIARRHYEDRRQGGGARRRCPMVEMHQVSYRDLPAMRSILELHSFPSPAGTPARSNIVGVIHLAAYKAVEESIRHPLRYYQNNINGLVDLVALLGEFAVKTFIFSSSAAVYGSLSAGGGRPLREEICAHPAERAGTGAPPSRSAGGGGITNPYGRTKLFAEAILSVLDVVRAMEAVSGRAIPRETVARRDGDVAASVAAVDRARRELCWETEKTLLDACYSVCSRLDLLPCRARGV
ncbi:UDP-glucose 4-epimerase, partial [Metarhizium brunneum ARSEF 3297]